MARCVTGRLVVGLLVLAVAGPAAAQPAAPTTPAPTLNYYGLLFLNQSEPLRKELKLTDDQAAKIAEHAVLRVQVTAASGDAKARAEALKAVDKAMEATLTADQRKRLRQIVLQQLAGGAYIRNTVLARIPEVTDELKLTDDQKAKVADGTSLPDVLTDAQKVTWQGMTGEKFDGVVRPTIAGRGRVALPPELQFLAEESVRDELKLTAEQQKQVADLEKPWLTLSFTSPFRTGPAAEEARKKAEALTRDTEAALAKVLDAGQQKRLTQIVLQQATEGGRAAALFARPEVVIGLALTDAQQAALKAKADERRQAMAALFLTGAKADEIKTAVIAHKGETYKQLAAVLDEGQRAKLKELVGEPFTGRVRTVGRGFGGGFPPTFTVPLAVSVSGVQFADSKPLHDELKLTEVQVKRLVELRGKAQVQNRATLTRSALGTPDYEKSLRERAAENDKALADILEPQQLARFHQVVLQYYVTARAPVPNQVTRFIEVADVVKLTAEQKAKLNDGEEVAKVLDAGQQAKYKALLGEPFARAASLRPPLVGRGGRVLNSHLQLLNEPAMRDELRLTADQIAKLPDLAKRWDELTKDRAEWGRGQAYAANMAAAREALDADIAKALDEKQAARFRQIELQLQRRDSLGNLLSAARVRKDLGLTAEQIAAVAAIERDANQTQSLMVTELLAFVDERPSPDYSKTYTAFTKVTDGKLTAVLMPEQQDKLKAMLGETFKGQVRGYFGGTDGFVPDAFGPGN